MFLQEVFVIVIPFGYGHVHNAPQGKLLLVGLPHDRQHDRMHRRIRQDHVDAFSFEVGHVDREYAVHFFFPQGGKGVVNSRKGHRFKIDFRVFYAAGCCVQIFL